MILKEFLENYDKENYIVLLEGKRDVLESDKQKLFELGKLLASKTTNMIFRSGNAKGADLYFSEGVCAIDSKRLEVITPYSEHRKKSNKAYQTVSLDEVNLMEEPDLIYQSKQNKSMGKLIDQFVSGEKNRNTIKAAYILRDTVKVIGTTNVRAANFAIFYDDLTNPVSGGTGHTMQVCIQNDVPFVDQKIWFDWLQ